MSDFFSSQLAVWTLARENHEALDHVLMRRIDIEGFDCPVVVQHNPARIRSTAAQVDKTSIAQRPCFLCPANRPGEQQALVLGDEWELLVNPYPILKEHYTLVAKAHRPQTIDGIVPVMRQALQLLGDDFMVFYNGPHCGASAPDHQHLQAGRWQGVPLIAYLLAHKSDFTCPTEISPLGFKVIVQPLAGLSAIPSETDDVNLVLVDDLLVTVPRRKHRPACYFMTDDRQRLISPGALDMCGLLIAPRREDFDRLTPSEARDILRECGEWTEPQISVGIMQAKEIHYEQHTDHFTLEGVTIGKQFHWQQQEQQRFEGTLRLVPDGDETWAVNDIPIEKYLKSVISSEMNPRAPFEFLKAHAIVSRSWLVAQLEHRQTPTETLKTPETPETSEIPEKPENILIRWYDREDHTLFDVCADDHCQRYQGLARITEAAAKAINETYGQVLTYEGQVVDARFSKCCGGITENYETCWDDTPHPELASVSDLDADGHAFCDTHDETLLRTILNNYDAATHDFFRWKVSYTPAELSRLIKEKSGIDFGTVTDLIPIERGASGRICRLKIIGTIRTLVVGKELEIRRILSPTHLYSSCFTPTFDNGIWTLEGRGWGHGVGMCQIGAAVMASKGYTCQQILSHYYPNATVERLWQQAHTPKIR
ncbi:MAG: DUF4922 domain-containing protein [Bacteroidaceae bacterium]|nr:DUF4922 domain-containing protein [Bacteroidaceae bacterium]